MNTFASSQSYTPEIAAEIQRVFLTRVYFWMTLGLAFTAGAAMFTMTQPALFHAILSNRILFFGLLIIEIGLVWGLSRMITHLTPTTAMVGFIGYATLNGVTLSILVLIYTASSIAMTFGICAGMFGTMSLFGYITKRDLSSWSNLLLMGLFGIIIASVINLFLASSALYWVITFVGLVLFVGLTAYDTQKIKNMSLTLGEDGAIIQKSAIIGALALYLDFINLFLMLLRLFGRRR